MSKVAMVTGASAGIGRAVAVELLKQGYKVALTGRREAELEATAALAGVAADKWLTAPADVSDEGSVVEVFDKIEEKFGRLDVLFNNAGNNVQPQTIDQIPFEDWKKVVDVNLNGAFLCAKYAFKLMRHQSPQGGRIINNGSISAQTPRPGSAPYTSTKHAMTGLTKTIALDGRPFNIACGQIDIGNAASAMTERMAKGVPQANGTIAPEPTMDVQHIAEAVLHMANLPLASNVLQMTIMASDMPLVGRG